MNDREAYDMYACNEILFNHESPCRGETIADVVGYAAELTFDATKPDGIPRKLMDSSRPHEMGWSAARTLRAGILQTYAQWCGTEQR